MTSPRLAAAIAELVHAITEEVAAQLPAPAPDRLLDVDEAAIVLGLGRSKLYAEIGAGRLLSVQVGRRRLIPTAAIRDYIDLVTRG
jgi:excisionase family DNA binding protein